MDESDSGPGPVSGQRLPPAYSLLSYIQPLQLFRITSGSNTEFGVMSLP